MEKIIKVFLDLDIAFSFYAELRFDELLLENTDKSYKDVKIYRQEDEDSGEYIYSLYLNGKQENIKNNSALFRNMAVKITSYLDGYEG